jgi:hypothetical protein
MADLRVSFPKPCDEKWEAMTPAGCARVCGRCDRPVHDLSLHSLDEAEALLRRDPAACVRARIRADGSVALKPGRRGEKRRMMIAIAATAGMLAASAPALAGRDRPNGAIVGNVESFWSHTRVTATDANGQTYRTRVKGDGRFRIGHLPGGTYTLSFVPDCGERWTVENIVVGAGETIVPRAPHEGQCIVVGLLRIENDRG